MGLASIQWALGKFKTLSQKLKWTVSKECQSKLSCGAHTQVHMNTHVNTQTHTHNLKIFKVKSFRKTLKKLVGVGRTSQENYIFGI